MGLGYPGAERLGVLLDRHPGAVPPRQGVYVPIAAIAIGFVLFWFVLADLAANGARTVGVDWIVLGDTRISWGIIVDRLSVTMLGLVTFVALLVQVYSLEYMRGERRIGWYYAVHALFAGRCLRSFWRTT